MANILFIVTISVCCVYFSSGLTIKDVIDERDELVKLKEYMKDLDFYSNQLKSHGPKMYTFFAPNNSAFANIPHQKQTRYYSGHISSAAKAELNDIFEYHAAFEYDALADVYVTYSIDEMGDLKVRSSADGSPSLFFRTIGDDHYVNGARILPIDDKIRVDNGVVHIIDTFLYEPPITTNALKFMKDHMSGSDLNMKFSLFAELLNEYEEQMNSRYPGHRHAQDVINGEGPMTLFLPSDAALGKLSYKKRQELKDDFIKLQGVIESHVIKTGAYHTGILSHVPSVIAINGEIQMGSYLNRVYVSNNCAKGSITRANLTVTNGALHVIDGVLGYVYSDIWDTLEERADLQDFFLLVRGISAVEELIDIPDTTTEVPDEDLYTVFAPINSGMTNTDFYGKASSEERVVKKHILRGRQELVTMTAELPHVSTLQSGESARFYQVNNAGTMETYVQVDYVRSKILDGDICVKNGIVHTTDHIVGLPSMTIYEYIQNTEDLRSLLNAVEVTGLFNVLSDESQSQTFLAPTNKAFDMMSEHSEGSKLLDISNRGYLKNVMNRQRISRVYILDRMSAPAETLGVEFNQETISVERRGSNYTILFDNRRIPVKMSDIRMKNGMLHVIDQVLFSYSAGASEWISGAGHVSLGHLLYCVLVGSVLFTSNLLV